MAAPRCHRCGHNFYTDSPNENGVCKWCQDEIDNPVYCHVCTNVATCTGQKGYLCDSGNCHRTDDDMAEEDFNEKYGE